MYFMSRMYGRPQGGEGTDGQFHVDESGQRGGEVNHLDFLVHIINR